MSPRCRREGHGGKGRRPHSLHRYLRRRSFGRRHEFVRRHRFLHRHPFLHRGADQGSAAQTPLNTETVAGSVSYLGLTARQTPATVEVIDQRTLTDRGLHTTTEAAQAARRGDGRRCPGAPASFSMRGFSGTQINTLYNGIKIGPSEMTGRVMDTANLEQIEILKGPASLMSGEGATGGAINYVTKRPQPARS